MFRKLVLLFFTLALFIPLSIAQEETTEAPETAVQFIELSGMAAERDAEISSLVWVGDQLLMITENPFLYADAETGSIGSFFALDKGDILDCLDSDGAEALEPYAVPLYGDDIMDAVSGYGVTFDGFEAAAVQSGLGVFVNDYLYLTIEADVNSDDTMRSFLVSGAIQPGLSGIDLALEQYIEIPVQTDFNNMSYESLFLSGNTLVAIYEANAESANPEPVAYEIDLTTGDMSAIDFPTIPYRVTDTTSVDADGVFWGINYFFPGEGFLGTDDDPLFAEYGRGASQTTYGQGINSDNPEWGFVERLVAFQYSADGITLVDEVPIQLLMTDESNGRNWEGIARLDDMGFLIVTDRFPTTLLGFVPAE